MNQLITDPNRLFRRNRWSVLFHPLSCREFVKDAWMQQRPPMLYEDREKAKENADDLLKEKIELEKQKKALIESAAEKDALLKVKVRSVGNLVHDSVPVSNNEV